MVLPGSTPATLNTTRVHAAMMRNCSTMAGSRRISSRTSGREMSAGAWRFTQRAPIRAAILEVQSSGDNSYVASMLPAICTTETLLTSLSSGIVCDSAKTVRPQATPTISPGTRLALRTRPPADPMRQDGSVRPPSSGMTRHRSRPNRSLTRYARSIGASRSGASTTRTIPRSRSRVARHRSRSRRACRLRRTA